MGRSVQGSGTEASVLDAWANDSVSAVSNDTPETLVLSGPKLNSFFGNLVGVAHEVTNDAWIASHAAVDQKIYQGPINATCKPSMRPGASSSPQRV